MSDLLLPFGYILQQVNCSFLTICQYQGVVEIEEVSLEALLGTGGGCFRRMAQRSRHEKVERKIKPEPGHLQYCKVK